VVEGNSQGTYKRAMENLSLGSMAVKSGLTSGDVPAVVDLGSKGSMEFCDVKSGEFCPKLGFSQLN